MTEPTSSARGSLARLASQFERAIISTLVVLMMLVVALACLDLGWLLVKDIITPPILILDVDELLELFGFFLLVLIGLELLESTKTYLDHRAVHVEVVLEVAVIALARKVIVLDKPEVGTVLAIAALVAALAISILVLRRSVPARR